MAKKIIKLDFVDIVLGANADVIKEAYEARVKVDQLLTVREEAYAKIAKIEDDIEEIVGVTGEFVFPAPPLPVAGMPKPSDATKPRKKKVEEVPEATVTDNTDNIFDHISDEEKPANEEATTPTTFDEEKEEQE